MALGFSDLDAFDYGTFTLNGQIFTGSTAIGGVVIPVYTATSLVWALWNPFGSGVEVLPINLDLGITATTSVAISGLAITALTNAGSEIGTGSPITSFTDTAPLCSRLGMGPKSKVRFAGGAATVAVAPVPWMSIGYSSETIAAQNGTQRLHYDFDGAYSVPPGNLISIGGSAAPGQTYHISMAWLEIPFLG